MVSHKCNAMLCTVERYGVYIAHLSTPVANSLINSADRCIRGYLHKWQQVKMLIGIALYVDIMKPSSWPSKMLNLDVVIGKTISM